MSLERSFQGISQRKLMDDDSIVLFCTYLSISPRKAIGSIWSHYIPIWWKKREVTVYTLLTWLRFWDQKTYVLKNFVLIMNLNDTKNYFDNKWNLINLVFSLKHLDFWNFIPGSVIKSSIFLSGDIFPSLD